MWWLILWSSRNHSPVSESQLAWPSLSSRGYDRYPVRLDTVANRSAEKDANELFRKHTIPEIRSLHAELGKDVEAKKQELRSMVGERYRDLILAADSIQTMKDVASQIHSLIGNVQDGCDALNARRNANATWNTTTTTMAAIPGNTTTHQLTEVDKKQQLYAIAAQIKLLVDTPEQIWHALEHHQYLRASKLYLVAKLIFKNIHSSKDTASAKAQASFPLLQRQWDAVSHFRTPIVQRATAYLKQTGQSPQELADTLCAIVLLDGAPPSEALLKLLEMRRVAAMDLLSGTRSSADDAATMLCSSIQLIELTLRQTAICFLAPPRPPNTPASAPLGLSSLESCIRKLTTPAPKQSTTSEQHHSLNGLYSEKTNLHILFRHLPSVVQSFVPYLHLPSPSSIVPESEVRKLVMSWIENVVALMKERAYNVLKSRVGSGTRLSQVRNAVLDLIYEIEFDGNNNHSSHSPGSHTVVKLHSSKQIPWNTITSQLLETRFSLWANLLRSPFVKRAKDLIETSFIVLTSQPSTLYISKLESLNSHDQGVEGFIWRLGKEGDGTTIKTLTPAITEITEMFEKGILEVKADIEPLFVTTTAVGKSDEDVFDLQSDAKSLAKDYQEATAKALQGYRDGLIALLDKTRPRGEHDPSERELRVDQGLFIGRAAQAIAIKSRASMNSVFLDVGFDSNSLSTVKLRTRRPSIRPTSAASMTIPSEPEPRLAQMHRMMMEVYVISHGPWTRSAADLISSRIIKGLRQTDWRKDGMAIVTQVWEPVAIQGSNDAGESIEEKVSLPVFASHFLVEALWIATKEINRIAGVSLDKAVLRNLLLELSGRILQAYAGFCAADLQTDDVSDKAAMQILFDLRYLCKVLGGAWNSPGVPPTIEQTNPERLEHGPRSEELIRCVKIKIDPIDLALVDHVISDNVERFYVRTFVMFGGLLDLNSRPLEGKKTPAVHELYNVIALAQGAPRFTLLPVPAPMSSRGNRARAGTKSEASVPSTPSGSSPQTSTLSLPNNNDTSSPSSRYRAAIRVAQRVAPSIEATATTNLFTPPSLSNNAPLALAQAGVDRLSRGADFLMNAGGFLANVLGGQNPVAAIGGVGQSSGNSRPATPTVAKAGSSTSAR
ncbi:hypothetical protein SeLEV6574_g04745 [Synchytrium endobioticum]|uniref:Conserved oligomeric Golgi complex subunit 1 n=1 Tax=Synchytrium endobioticum TaxID=286115 RepID=A0A507CY50_9FUNG|nr:hypothetical protein SeLEV6574_g04745 [Synchytrium endobioticum]